MIEPVFSPKMEAYISVLDKIKNFRLKRGLFTDEYTKQVNLEINGIRKRLMAAAHRARRAELIRKMCEKDPQLAARLHRMKLSRAYINTFKRKIKLEDQIAKLMSTSSTSSTSSTGVRHAGQD